MNRKEQQVRQKRIIAEYLKGTRVELISAFFDITKAGLYYLIKKYKIKKRNKTLDK